MDDKRKDDNNWLNEQRPKGDVFRLPDGYFDSLEDRVFSRIEAAGLERKVPVLGRKKRAKRLALFQVLMAAAAVFSLLLAAMWFMKPTSGIDQPIASIELNEAEIENYLLENIHDFEADQLAMLPEISENEFQPPVINKSKPSKSTIDPYEISPDDLDLILNDMTEEELEDIF